MRKVIVCFDIDGTLRCNCTAWCRDTNERIVNLAALLASMKNVKLMCWSGGGKEYAQGFIDSDDRLSALFGTRCFSKSQYIEKFGIPDIAIDDQQEFSLAKINLIVREK